MAATLRCESITDGIAAKRTDEHAQECVGVVEHLANPREQLRDELATFAARKRCCSIKRAASQHTTNPWGKTSLLLTAVEVSCRKFPRAEQRLWDNVRQRRLGLSTLRPKRQSEREQHNADTTRICRGYAADMPRMQNSSAEEPTAPAYLNHLEKSECAFSSTSCAYPVPHSKYRIMQPCHMHHAACGTT